MKKSMILLGMLSIGYAYAQEERVGINTETPSATLNVKTKTNATSPKNLELENQGGTKLLTVLNAGRVGLLNETPGYLLDINGHNNGSYENSSIVLRMFRDGASSGGFNFLRAKGTSTNPLAIAKGDHIGNIGFSGYTGSKYLSSYHLSSIVTGDVSETDVPSSLRFVRFHTNGTSATPLTIHHTGDIGINTVNPTAALEIVSNMSTAPQAQRENGKVDAILIDVARSTPTNLITKERRASISGGMKAFHTDYRSHSIDFGLIDLATATRPFMAFSVAPYQGSPTNEDKTVEHMRIMHTGNIGIGTTAPTHKLHIKANTNPLKLEGLQASTVSTDKILVADENGVVKTIEKSSLVSAPTSTDAVQVGSTTSMTCNDANRGKMNFVKDVTIGSGTGDAFAVCLKGTDGKFYWRYLYGASGVTTSTENFGTGLQ